MTNFRFTQPCQKSSWFSLLKPSPVFHYYFIPFHSNKTLNFLLAFCPQLVIIPQTSWKRHNPPCQVSCFNHQSSICNYYLLFPSITQRKCLSLDEMPISPYLLWTESSLHSLHLLYTQVLIWLFLSDHGWSGFIFSLLFIFITNMITDDLYNFFKKNFKEIVI